MQLNIKDLVKEQIIYILVAFVFFAALIAGSIYTSVVAYKNFSDYEKNSRQIAELSTRKVSLENELEALKREEKGFNIQKIYTLEGSNFGVDASFAPLFDNMLSIAKDSGVRIRSVKYNFSPAGDPVYDLKLAGHNVCELSSTIVGNYSEIQNFIKTMISQKYLVTLSQLEIVSWKRDKSVLIANLKLVFYTKTK